MKLSETAQSQWTGMCEAAKLLHETKDCAVKAVTAVTGVHYMDVHSLMAACGRRHRKGTPNHITRAVLDRLGFVTEEVKAWSKTVRTLGREFKGRSGTYLVWTSRHILAIKDGEVLDWTNGRLHRVLKVECVRSKRETQPPTTMTIEIKQ